MFCLVDLQICKLMSQLSAESAGGVEFIKLSVCLCVWWQRHPQKDSVCVYMWCYVERHHLFRVTVMKWGALWYKASDPFITAVGGPSIFPQSCRDTSTHQGCIELWLQTAEIKWCVDVCVWQEPESPAWTQKYRWIVRETLTAVSFACYLPHLMCHSASFAWCTVAELHYQVSWESGFAVTTVGCCCSRVMR